MRDLLKYRVYDRDGNLLAKGTAEECAEAIGYTLTSFRSAISPTYENPKYVIQPEPREREKETRADLMAAVKAWDEFVTPIREYYGVPRYRPRSENRA